MIKKEEIYFHTRGGLDVFRLLWDDAARVIDNGDLTKPFKRRQDERTASCHFKRKSGKDGEYWLATDFGDDQQPRNCFDWVIREFHLQGFKEACAWIVTNLNLDIYDIKPETNKPERIEVVETDAPNHTVLFELREDDVFTDAELETFGPLVTNEVMSDLNWHPVLWCGVAKDGKVRRSYSCDSYPIYARECITADPKTGEKKSSFWKIYKPLEWQKQYRFMVSGQRPPDYVNGLYELRRAYRRWNDQQQAKFEADPLNEGKPYKEEKLPCAVMASGERDCACVHALGAWPIWLNSETADLTAWQEKEVLRLVDTLYNIPDRDVTGLRRGTYHALRHTDIKTVWLPQWFQKYHDARHHQRKDFRDYMELIENSQQEFKRLLDNALAATFWTKRTTKSGKDSYEVNSVSLLYFLGLNGFHKFRDQDSGQAQFVRVDGNIVESVTPQDMSEFLIRWSQGKEKIPGSGDKMSEVQPLGVQNMIIDSARCAPSALERVSTIDIDFTTYTPTAQWFAFRNCVVKVTAEGIKSYRRDEAADLPVHFWKNDVIDHDFRPLPPLFEIKKQWNEVTEDDDWTIDLHGADKCKLLGYLVNSSRLHWRKELEEPFNGLPLKDAASLRDAYRREHLFEITSPKLSESENLQQQRCLVNKLFAMGYFCWGFKSESNSYAALSMDWKVDEMGECNGGSGKSFFFGKALSQLLPSDTIDGKDDQRANSFQFERVTSHTRLVLIDDAARDFSLERLFVKITGSFVVNPKGLKSYVIPFSRSPKVAITTNYVPRQFDGSSDRRLLYMVSSDYYHSRGPAHGDYHETRRISDDFGGRDLYGADYSSDDWNQDYNLMLQALQFYMQHGPKGVKIQPPMDNIMLRSSRQIMADKFFEWAQEYFAPDSDKLNCLIERDTALVDFRTKYNMKDITSNMFFKKLKAFSEYCTYIEELNPSIYCAPSKPGHIIKRRRLPDGGFGASTEWLYIRGNATVLQKLKEERERYEADIDTLPTTPVDPNDETAF